MNYARAVMSAVVGDKVLVDRARAHVPGSLTIRLSTVLGNRRIHRLMDPFLVPGAVVVDVGANIGFNTLYAAQRVGPSGRVLAVEPADDNIVVLRGNVERSALSNITILPVAAGRISETRQFFLRGDVSAVNSFYPDSVYAAVTGVVDVPVQSVDDMLDGNADLVKIDVEGAELDVLGGMTRLLRHPGVRLVVEWHPLLQEKAGYAADELPRALRDLGFTLTGASHLHTTPLLERDVPGLVDQLRRTGRPIDILAVR
jgi:FkbM family methyltransferase